MSALTDPFGWNHYVWTRAFMELLSNVVNVYVNGVQRWGSVTATYSGDPMMDNWKFRLEPDTWW